MLGLWHGKAEIRTSGTGIEMWGHTARASSQTFPPENHALGDASKEVTCQEMIVKFLFDTFVYVCPVINVKCMLRF